MSVNHKIFIAESESDFRNAKEMVLAYAEFLNADLSFQNFEGELKSFNIMYSSPKGSMLLAENSGNVVGAVGLRYLSEGVAEMKRMFVLPKFQGHGIGDALMSAFIKQACKLGYSSIKLDTIPELDKAIRLYKKHNFVQIKAYRYNPHPGVQYYELKIS